MYLSSTSIHANRSTWLTHYDYIVSIPHTNNYKYPFQLQIRIKVQILIILTIYGNYVAAIVTPYLAL